MALRQNPHFACRMGAAPSPLPLLPFAFGGGSGEGEWGDFAAAFGRRRKIPSFIPLSPERSDGERRDKGG